MLYFDAFNRRVVLADQVRLFRPYGDLQPLAPVANDKKLLSPWPIARLPNWVERVNEPLTEEELAAVRVSAQRGRPLGDEGWVESIARRLSLESTIRPRGRQRIRMQEQEAIKGS